MTGSLCSGPPGLRALAAALPCVHRWRIICDPPSLPDQAHLAREGFTAAEIAAIGALVTCQDCNATGWVPVRPAAAKETR